MAWWACGGAVVTAVALLALSFRHLTPADAATRGRYAERKALLDQIHKSATTLAEALDRKMPTLREDDDVTRLEVGVRGSVAVVVVAGCPCWGWGGRQGCICSLRRRGWYP